MIMVGHVKKLNNKLSSKTIGAAFCSLLSDHEGASEKGGQSFADDQEFQLTHRRFNHLREEAVSARSSMRGETRAGRQESGP